MLWINVHESLNKEFKSRHDHQEQKVYHILFQMICQNNPFILPQKLPEHFDSNIKQFYGSYDDI